MNAWIQKHRRLAGALMTLLGGMCWGISGTCGQFLFTQRDVTSAWLVPMRMLTAGIIVLGWQLITKRGAAFAPWRDKRDARELLIYALPGVTMCQLTYFTTIQLSSAAAATILQALAPVPILAVGCIAAKKLPTAGQVFCILLALSGVMLLVGSGSSGLNITPAALAVGLLSAVTVMIYNVVPARLLTRYPSALLQGWAFLLGGITLCAVFRPWRYEVHPDVWFVLAFAAVVVLGNVCAFVLYLTGVHLIGPDKSSLYAFSEPVTAAVLGCVCLHNAFTLRQGIGFVLVLGALALLSLRKN